MSTSTDRVSHRQTLDQRRASSAWQSVSGLPADRSLRQDYRSAVLKLPAMLLVNGLGQSLAFVYSKKREPAHQQLYQHLSTWVSQELRQRGDLLQYILQADVDAYRLAQREALAYAEWLKRFAEALIDAPAPGERN